MIVLDTNALMMPVECDVRLFEELDRVLGGVPTDREPATPRPAGGAEAPAGVGTPDTRSSEFVVPAAVLAELDRLADGAGAEATAASVGRDLADRCRTVDVETPGDAGADAAVLALGTSPDCLYVVTNDADLRGELLDRGVPVIGLRARHKLAITRP